MIKQLQFSMSEIWITLTFKYKKYADIHFRREYSALSKSENRILSDNNKND